MLKTRISILGVILTSAIALASCDNGDTTVAVNYSFDSTASDVQSAVKKLVITITGEGKSPVMTDYELERNADSGALTSLTFKRITLNGWSGDVDVKVDAVDSSGTTLLSASVKAHLSEHSAVAAMVKFKREVAPADGGTSDAGSGSGGSTGSGGSSASGGSTGSGGSASSDGGSGGSASDAG